MKNKKTQARSRKRRGRAVHETRYELPWRNKHLTAEAKSVTEMADTLQGAANDLRELAAAGVALAPGSAEDDYAILTTDDAEVAERFGFHLAENSDEE